MGLYLPIDFVRHANLGYAFVNLLDSDIAARFWKCFDGFSEWSTPTQKVCEVSWSKPCQGLRQHIDRFRNSPVMHESVPDACRPIILYEGTRVAFPPPTRAIQPPQCRDSRN